MSKRFPTLDVLGAVTGRLLGKMDGIYEVCNYASGESVYTHQLPRVCRELRAAMLKRFPDLQQEIDESELITRDNVGAWAADWLERHGATMEVCRLTADQHERIDPISELSEMVHPSKIVIVETGK